jgi:hypothetical protein
MIAGIGAEGCFLIAFSLSIEIVGAKATVLFTVLPHNGGACNACTINQGITLLCISKQITLQNGVVP